MMPSPLLDSILQVPALLAASSVSDLGDKLFNSLYKNVSLQTVGIIVGIVLLVTHVWALVKADATREWMKKLPRSQSVGTVLLTVAFLWSLMVMGSIDLGEFAPMRKFALWALPLMYLSMLFYTNEYLGARSLGMVLALFACPMLNSAFLKEPVSRLLIPTLAYVWLTLGLFYIGMPYLLRNHVAWLSKSALRWRLACLGGILYGVLVLTCAFVFWGGY